MNDRIVSGDKVSYALPIPGAVRTFGTVYRVARSKTFDGKRQTDYGIKSDDNGQNHLVPERFVTKECA